MKTVSLFRFRITEMYLKKRFTFERIWDSFLLFLNSANLVDFS